MYNVIMSNVIHAEDKFGKRAIGCKLYNRHNMVVYTHMFDSPININSKEYDKEVNKVIQWYCRENDENNIS